MSELPDLVRQLRDLVGRLERRFPERRFTLDGHLLGSIGEVLAAEIYGLRLLSMTEPGHDAVAADETKVQIKITQGAAVGLRAQPQHLLVLQLHPDGTTTEVYNGPGDLAWNAAGKMQRNGQRPIRVTRLRDLMAAVPAAARIPPLTR